jgi:hypothetical protein
MQSPNQLPPNPASYLPTTVGDPPFNKQFDYQSVISKLNYLEKSTRPDILYAVHQCARFLSDPRKLHSKAVKYLARYLKGSWDKGLIICPNANQFDFYVDADFAGNWDKDKSVSNVNMARSRM